MNAIKNHWLQFLFRPSRLKRRPSRLTSGPAEILEVREVPTAFVVNAGHDITRSDNQLTLREAVAAANANPGPDTITFAQGLAGALITLSRDAGYGELRVTDDLTIVGIPDNPATRGDERITVSGNGSNDRAGTRLFVVDDGNVSRDINATLSNLNLTRGWTRSLPGGAIVNNEKLTVNAVTFYDNASFYDVTFLSRGTVDPVGGAIANYGVLTVNSSTFTSNSAPAAGGAIFNAGRLDVSNSSFVANTSAADGGALYNTETGDATIRNSVFSANTAGETGAAIDNRGRLGLENSQVTDNRLNYGQGGAGIHNGYGANAVIRNSEILRNTVVVVRTGIGGAGILNYGNLDVDRSAISGNRVNVPYLEDGLLKGGGINVQAGTVNITNTVFASNFARQGGAIHVENGFVRVASSQFIGNSSLSSLGGSNFFSPITGPGAGSAYSVTNGSLTFSSDTIFRDNSAPAADGSNSRVTQVAYRQPSGSVTFVSPATNSGTSTSSGTQVATDVTRIARPSPVAGSNVSTPIVTAPSTAIGGAASPVTSVRR